MAYNERLTDKERKVLTCAADHIEAHGWIQGVLFKDPVDFQNSPCCLLGGLALCLAPEKPIARLPQLDAERLAGRLKYGRGNRYTGWRWNDFKCRTKEEVIALLRNNAS